MKIRLNRTDEKYIYTSKYFRYVKTKRVYRSGQKDPVRYMDKAMYFDSETSHKDLESAWVYQWAFEFYGQYVTGRTARQFVAQLKQISNIYHLDDKNRMIIYVHNLSYDFTYIFNYLIEIFQEEPKLLALDPHKILTATVSGIEFRCSYLLSNMSLDQWSKKLHTPTKKMVGAIDYDAVRYPDTPLSVIDWEYQINDVQTLKECVEIELKENNDTLATIPLTSTGYVRRDIRNETRKNKEYRKWFEKTRLDVDSYKLCRSAFSGGYTHGNRFFSGKTVRKSIGHFDFKSHYPSREQLDYFPVTKFVPYFEVDTDGKMEKSELVDLCKTKCCLIKIAISDVHLRKGVTAPMLSLSKAENVNFSFKADNGRILEITGRIPAIYVLTELDYKWLCKQYTFNQYIISVYTAERGQCPEPIRITTNKYFEIKETLDDGYLYMKSKNKLNAIYGCSATDPVRADIVFNYKTNEWKITKKLSDNNISEKLDKFYNSRNSFMPYQIGVWTTAHARDKLFTLIEKIGYEYFLYADTDSIFFIQHDGAQEIIDNFNKNVITLNKEKSLGVHNRKNTISYYGTFEDEKEDIIAFRFLHSKCYAFVTKDNKLHCTIAGVTATNKQPKDSPLYKTREQELQSIDNLDIGFTFTECGGTRSVYLYQAIEKSDIDGHILEIASACIIEKTTKKLSNNIEEVEIYETV